MSRRTQALALAASLLLPAAAAHATVMRAVNFDEKVEKAASIVLGRCVRQESKWDEAHHWILTYSTFQVEKTLKGGPAQEITIVTPGGTVGDIAQDVVGAPTFRQGDEHVVFVRNSQAGPTVLYFEQGAYRVLRDDRGERFVKPLASNAVTIDTQRGAAEARERVRTLSDFEGSVRDTLRRREVQRMEMLDREKREQASIWSQVQRNKSLVVLALLGALLATWQLIRRW